MDPNDLPNGAQIEPGGAKMEAKVGPDTPKIEKKQQRNNERKSIPQCPPLLAEKCRQHGPNLAPKMEPKSEKKSIPKTIKFWVAFEIGFSPILIDFRSQNGAKMAAKWDLKSM